MDIDNNIACFLIGGDKNKGHQYTDENIDHLTECEYRLVEALWDGGHATYIQVTKIILGIFANVPAFDDNFTKGLGIYWRKTGLKGILPQVKAFYENHKTTIDSHNIATLDFTTGQQTHRKYTKAKLIDMIGFIEGKKEDGHFIRQCFSAGVQKTNGHCARICQVRFGLRAKAGLS